MKLREVFTRSNYRSCSILCIVVLILMILVTAVSAAESLPDGKNPVSSGEVTSITENLPLFFVPNEGQMDPRVLFTARGKDFTLYFLGDRVIYQLYGDSSRTVVIERFSGGNPAPILEGIDPLETRVSYFTGKASEWHTNITPFQAIVYHDVYPGIDVIYRGMNGTVKSEFLVRPGADPYSIRMTYEGTGMVRMAGNGGLVISTDLGQIMETAPVCYQETRGGRTEIPCRFDVRDDDGSASFYVGPYDRSLPLWIDPVLAYCGYIGGSGSDLGFDIAVDGSGNSFIAGSTYSTETTFPEVAGPDTTHNGGSDAFVAKVNAAGTILEYCGYIGGSGNELGSGIAVDNSGCAYIAGTTNSAEASFPVTAGPDLAYDGGNDAFVAKVNAAGTALVYCGYIGGTREDYAMDIAVDSLGDAYVIGYTNSSETNGFPALGSVDSSFNGGIYDVFIARVISEGLWLDYCGYIGGGRSIYENWPNIGDDYGNGIAVDSARNAYITGVTSSSQLTFPVTGGPDLTYNSGSDAFAAKISAAGTELIYCGYIGGSGNDGGTGIAVDSSGNAYITGGTDSTVAMGFPATVGPDLTYNGGEDAFVAKVNTAGNGLAYCGYIGGSGYTSGTDIAVDSTGNAYVTGYTSSTQATFPDTIGPDLTYNGGSYDVFVAEVAGAGTGLDYCGYIGGSGEDKGEGISVDWAGNAYITGSTSSTEATFPETVGPDLTHNSGTIDAFVAKVTQREECIGLFRPSTSRWYLDYDSNGLSDYKVYWGASTDIPLTGDWDFDRLDEIGLWRPSTCRWYLDYDNNGLSNYQVTWGANTDIPITGDWDKDGYDEIGLFRPSTSRWYLDYDNNGRSDYQVTWGASTDIPITGDWNNDAFDEIGLFRPSTARWYLDYDNNGLSDYQVTWGASTDRPVTGDWDNDGYDEIGLFRPSTARWYLDYDNNGLSNYQVTWGAGTDKPVTGMWT